MDRSTEIREFLRTRRARITPEQAGLVPHARASRVPGLRREEVAQIAGSASTTTSAWSVAVPGASPKPFWRPSPAPCNWRTPNARTCSTSPNPPRSELAGARLPLSGSARFCTGRWRLSASPRWSRADAWTSWPPTGYALYTDFEGRPHRERNFARFVFLDEAARTLYVDWELIAGNCVAALRLYAGRHPDDSQLTELIGELVGDLTLDYVVLAVEGDPEQTLVVYTPEPASPSAEAVNLLASWTSTSTTGPHAPDRHTTQPAEGSRAGSTQLMRYPTDATTTRRTAGGSVV